MSEPALGNFLREIIKQGKKQGGYITYHQINAVLQCKQDCISVTDIDIIYERLLHAGIKIVDQLPCHPQKDESTVFPRKGVNKKYQTKPRETLRWHWLESREFFSDPEAAIDWLLACGQKTGEVGYRAFLVAIRTYHLLPREIEEVAEYLMASGIDLPKVDLAQIYTGIRAEKSRAEEKGQSYFDSQLRVVRKIFTGWNT